MVLTSSLIAALILGLATAATGVTGAITSAEAQKEMNRQNIEAQKETNLQTMAFNSAEAEKERQWQTEMSNTQVQRAMADYQAAGLNPLLAVPGGASYAGGASASASLTAPKGQAVSAVGDAMNSLSSAAMSMANLMLVSKLVDSKTGNKGLQARDLAALRSYTSAFKHF